ncbi:MAG: GNAT family N-acetyltransferase [Pseudomonadota bacterium]
MMDATNRDWAEKVAAFVDVFDGKETRDLVANLTTRVERIDIDGAAYPITINERHMRGNCYVCDPLAGYIDYGIEETRNFARQPLLQSALVGLIKSAAPLMRATGLGRVVHVNNWLLSTNPAPVIRPQHATRLRDCILNCYPTHAILVRSLNDHCDRATIKALVAAGFELFPSRQVYIFDGRHSPPWKTRDLRRDRRLLFDTPFQQIRNEDFSACDYPRAIALYNMLYLEKYTRLNPQYTPECLMRLHQKGVLHLDGFRDADGALVAVGGRLQMGGILTQPIVGYDTTRPKKDGLYRLIIAAAQADAVARGLILNMSAGAAEFKRNRCARAAIEYSAVYARHLTVTNRAALYIVRQLLNRIGVPLMRRFEL